MRYPIIFLLTGGLCMSVYSQQIFRTNLEGVAVQSFASDQPIDGFTVSGPDEDGYVYLVAHAGSKSGEIVRTLWQGTGFQPVSFCENDCLTGFDVRGPDQDGYVYLSAVGSDGSCAEILRSLLTGVAVHPFASQEAITSFIAYGPDEDGYVYLSAGTRDSTQRWIQTPEFALAEVANPCTDIARISYSVARSCKVSISIYDALGRVVANLVDAEQSAGAHELSWDALDRNGKHVNAGVYFVRMDAGSFVVARKLVVVR